MRSLKLVLYITISVWLCGYTWALAQKWRYFAFGSNMVRSTLTAFRQVQPLNASAAVLPDFRLRFNIGGGGWLDGAAASVESCAGENVHGVVYELSAQDFARVGSTEGVPFVYRWQKCQIYPYIGNDESAGLEAIENSQAPIMAYTLVKTFSASESDSPPSKSYRDILIQGAQEWKLDKSYQEQLKATPVADNLLLPDGVSGLALKFAEYMAGQRQRYKQAP